MSERRWVDDSLFVDPSETVSPTLAGARCPGCATTTFPYQDGCPRCGGEAMDRVALPTSGTLWSFTVQYFPPKTPYRGFEPFQPYGVGYVDLGDVCVEARLTVADPGALSLGMPMQLVVLPAFPDGEVRVDTFAFAPQEVSA
ncbi:Zn-ribbon domain-containing OB-fold protein [Nocardioides sp. SYSU DS0651]|uniref:Zn-ribbon domain-containing OB-fold protein n=1 Tax=Nocardioides sp. SYSU DS0651 TaxID=3415955 RepID=UPI003F4B105D